MKEFKYTIAGKEYKVEIGEIDGENVADITVNGEQYKVQMEKEVAPEKKKVELGKPATNTEEETTNTALLTLLMLLKLHYQVQLLL